MKRGRTARASDAGSRGLAGGAGPQALLGHRGDHPLAAHRLAGAIYAGPQRLIEAPLGREWRRDDGAMVRIDRCLIDANWGQSSDVVYQFCRQSKHAGIVMPAHGRYVGASSIPFADYKRKRGDRVGLNWRIPLVGTRRSVRHAKCGCEHFRVIYTRRAWGGKVVRSRECRRCGKRVITYERVAF